MRFPWRDAQPVTGVPCAAGGAEHTRTVTQAPRPHPHSVVCVVPLAPRGHSHTRVCTVHGAPTRRAEAVPSVFLPPPLSTHLLTRVCTCSTHARLRGRQNACALPLLRARSVRGGGHSGASWELKETGTPPTAADPRFYLLGRAHPLPSRGASGGLRDPKAAPPAWPSMQVSCLPPPTAPANSMC